MFISPEEAFCRWKQEEYESFLEYPEALKFETEKGHDLILVGDSARTDNSYQYYVIENSMNGSHHATGSGYGEVKVFSLRHKGQKFGNAAMLDGHAEALSADDLRQSGQYNFTYTDN